MGTATEHLNYHINKFLHILGTHTQAFQVLITFQMKS